jgi:hypothetical protein
VDDLGRVEPLGIPPPEERVGGAVNQVEDDGDAGRDGLGLRIVPEESERHQANPHRRPPRERSDELPAVVEVDVRDSGFGKAHALRFSGSVQVDHTPGRPPSARNIIRS